MALPSSPVMSVKQSELEGRLDDMLSRIAMETQEIRELEQQLTDGQILANESLQRDLEEIICGLQEYLRGLREQARRSQQQVLRLQNENLSLQRLLVDAQGHCRQLEDTSRTRARVAQDQDQDQDHINQLETQVARDQDHIAQLEAQDQEPDWRLKEELETLRVRLQRSQTRNRHVQHNLSLQLQDVQRERDALRQQLRSQSDGHQKILGRLNKKLNKKLRQLSRFMCDSDQLTAEQLRALNHLVEQLHTHTHQQGDRCECVHKEAERLEEQKLHTLRRQHSSVLQVCDEVECVEKTLLKRRAELREADRLLLEAELQTQELKLLQELLVEQQALEG